MTAIRMTPGSESFSCFVTRSKRLLSPPERSRHKASFGFFLLMHYSVVRCNTNAQGFFEIFPECARGRTCYRLCMRKEASLPVRLESETKARLQKTAQAMGVTPSALIRILVCSFVDEFERSGGKTTIPPQWPSMDSAGPRENKRLLKAAERRTSYKIRRTR